MEPLSEHASLKHSNKPVDKLESDRLPPPIEAAAAEYFADMAFDNRLLMLLETSPATTHIRAQHVTQAYNHGIGSLYFKENAMSPTKIYFDDEPEYLEAPAYAFSIEGDITQDTARLLTDITITPDNSDDASVKVENDPINPDVFYISKLTDELAIDVMSTEELFTLLCQLEGARQSSLDTLLAQLDDNNLRTPKDMQRYVVQMWERLGEAHGTRCTVRTLSHSIEEPASPHHPEAINLTHEEIEEPQKTTIKLSLKHTTTMPELNVTDAYNLRLVFEQNNEVVDKHAERTVISGIEPQLVSANIYHQHNGRTTQLDIDTIAIKELFIDWFDQLITA